MVWIFIFFYFRCIIFCFDNCIFNQENYQDQQQEQYQPPPIPDQEQINNIPPQNQQQHQQQQVGYLLENKI